jgi:hypothetical protein
VASARPLSELGQLTGVPQQAQQAPLSLPSVPQLKAKSALGSFAAQRVAGLAPQTLDLVTNALAAGRRGQCHAISKNAACFAIWFTVHCQAASPCTTLGTHEPMQHQPNAMHLCFLRL